MLTEGPKLSIDDTDPWKFFFSRFMSDCEVSANDETITVTADNTQISSFIEKLRSPDLVLTHLGYAREVSGIQVPEIIVGQGDDASSSLIINRNQLINFLHELFEEGFILAEDQGSLVPICLPEVKVAKAKNLYSFVLDYGFNTQPIFYPYINCVKDFIKKILLSANEGDVFRIVACADEFSRELSSGVFKVLGDDREGVRRQIFRHLDEIMAGNGSDLYSAIHDELKSLEKYPGYSSSMLVFTADLNSGFTTEKELQEQLDRQPAVKVFTVCLGDNVDKDVLEGLSTQRGGSFSMLKKIDELKNVLEQLEEKMRRPRLLVKKIAQEGRVAPPFSIYENTLAIAPIKLEPGVSFTYGDRTFCYRKGPGLVVLMPEELPLEPTPFLLPGFKAATDKSPEEALQQGPAPTATSTRWCNFL